MLDRGIFVVLPLLLVFGMGPVIEWLAGARLSPKSFFLNLGCWCVPLGTTLLLGPAALAGAAILVGTGGGGMIALPSEGWSLLWALPLFALTMELGDYAFHRAQHAWAPLWAMHSLHHSDEALGITTSVRHFWAEGPIRTLCVYPVVFLIVKPNLTLIAIYNVMLMWGYTDHLNVRLSFGPFRTFLTSPQYHRIHHSTDIIHRDRNFAAIFPIIDVVFGTAYWPAKNEYPRSGLDTGEEPDNVLEAALWPLIRHRRRLRALAHPDVEVKHFRATLPGFPRTD